MPLSSSARSLECKSALHDRHLTHELVCANPCSFSVRSKATAGVFFFRQAGQLIIRSRPSPSPAGVLVWASASQSSAPPCTAWPKRWNGISSKFAILIAIATMDVPFEVDETDATISLLSPKSNASTRISFALWCATDRETAENRSRGQVVARKIFLLVTDFAEPSTVYVAKLASTCRKHITPMMIAQIPIVFFPWFPKNAASAARKNRPDVTSTAQTPSHATIRFPDSTNRSGESSLTLYLPMHRPLRFSIALCIFNLQRLAIAQVT